MNLRKGARITIERTFRQDEFAAFAEISGDDNPIHLDTEFSATSGFGRTVAHGMLIYSVLQGLLERLVPGDRQETVELMFPAPAFADDPLRFHAEIVECVPGRAEVAMEVTQRSDGATVCAAHAVMRIDPEAAP